MLICCSSDCEKCKQCGRYIYNLSDKYKNQMNTVEPLASFGWGSVGINAQGETHCETHTDCGFNGKYALFEPIENADTKLKRTTMTDEEQILEMAKIIDDRLIEARNWLGSMNRREGYWIAQELIKHYQPKLSEDAVVLTKEEYDGKEIVVEMSSGHKLRLSVSKFGEMSQIHEKYIRKEMATEICSKIIKDLPQPLQEKWKEFFAKEYGVEIKE